MVPFVVSVEWPRVPSIGLGDRSKKSYYPIYLSTYLSICPIRPFSPRGTRKLVFLKPQNTPLPTPRQTPVSNTRSSSSLFRTFLDCLLSHVRLATHILPALKNAPGLANKSVMLTCAKIPRWRGGLEGPRLDGSPGHLGARVKRRYEKDHSTD